MTHDRQPATELEAALRRHFRDRDPGPPPLELRRRIDEVPATFDRLPTLTPRRLLGPVLGLAAALAIVALGLRLLPLSGTGIGPGATSPPTSAFDPARTGLGLAPAFDAAASWFFVLVAAVALFALGIGLRGRRAILPVAAAAGVVIYGLVGTFAPIDLHITGEGPGLNVAGVSLPAGAEGTLYYETAKPGEPYAFGILLIGGTIPQVRIDGLVDEWPEVPDYGGMHWTSIWLDGEPNGGMMGPERPFAPFDMPQTGQAVWLVGRAGSCALGRAPAASEALGVTWIPTVRLNVSVYGWPRVVELSLPRIAEPMKDPCEPSWSPGPNPEASTSP